MFLGVLTGMCIDVQVNWVFHGALMGINNDVLVSPWLQGLLSEVLQVFHKGLVN